MPIASDWTISTINKTIKHSSGSSIYTVNALYTYLLDYFDEESTIQYYVPMSAQTPTEYTLINGWFLDDTSTQYLSGGAIQTSGWNTVIYILTMSGTPTNPISSDIGKVVTNGGGTHTGTLLDYTTSSPYKWYVRATLGTFSAESLTITSGTGAGTISSVVTGETIWSNIFSLGSLVAGTTLDVYQNDTQITPFWTSGHIDILVRVKEASVETDSGNLTVLARLYGTLYDHYVIDASTGRNPVPLAAFDDTNNDTASGTVGAYSGFTFTFGYASKNFAGQSAYPYDCVINCNNHTLLEVYEYLKYVTRTNSATTLNSVSGEYYTGVGDLRIAYSSEASGPFVEGSAITSSAGGSAYIVSLLDNGTTGYLTIRNVHGTFADTNTLTSGSTTATVNGAPSTITQSKQAPFGTYAGGQFFGARGVWLDNVASADANNYDLIDSTGTTQSPPTTIAITVNGVVSGDKVSVFRADDTNGTINRAYMTSHNINNTAGLSTFEVTASMPNDTPSAGRLRIRNSTGTTEYHIRYTSRTSTVFTLRTAVTGTITAVEDVTGTSFTANNASLSTIEPGDLVRNTADGTPGSWAQIITVTDLGSNNYRFTHTPLSGGTDNQWNTGDTYSFHTLPLGFNNTYTAYVPYIDSIATSTSVSTSVTYVSDRYISTQVRRKGIIPFTTNSVSLTSSGYTATAVRTTDSIVT